MAFSLKDVKVAPASFYIFKTKNRNFLISHTYYIIEIDIRLRGMK